MSETLESTEQNIENETIPFRALETHDKTREIIASELGADQLTAEREVGGYFLDKIESDLQENAPQDVLIIDVDAALISGSTQLEAEGGLFNKQNPELTDEALLDNPVTELENTHPDLVTDGVIELASYEKTSKFAQIVAVVTDKLRTLANKATPSNTELKEINPVEASVTLTSKEIVERLELERTVKLAPSLSEQIQDTSRTNEIVYIAGLEKGAAGSTSDEKYRAQRASITEQAALRQLDEFLGSVATSKSRYADKAAKMRERITFIGEKEYMEAAAGIASYWKAELDKNESLTILAMAGLAKMSDRYNEDLGGEKIKSDDFLLEHVLSHFSDEELSKYGGRLIVDHDDLPPGIKAKDLRVILLDDWSISGSQLSSVRRGFVEKYPRLSASVEVQLIAANEEVIKHGLDSKDAKGRRVPIPTRAYYTAHSSEEYGSRSGTHITGFHSSVDFDFETVLADMVLDQRRNGQENATMVAPANIVRPYRSGDASRKNSFVQRERVRAQAERGARESDRAI